MSFRKVELNGRTGIVAARNESKELLFVLFDGDDVSESAAGWFAAASVTLV